jgi:exosortase
MIGNVAYAAGLRSAFAPMRTWKGWLCAAVAVAFVWSYWSTFAGLAETWMNNPRYSHGFMVPAFAVLLLWMRRGELKTESVHPSAWGLPLLGVAALIRLTGAYFYFPWLDAVSLLPALAGLSVLLGGTAALRASWPAIGFLAFMLPLPFVVEGALATRLQSFATFSSTYVLQTLGLPALAQGNVITVNETKIGVAEACNGLGMLMSFFAISTALAFILSRPLWEKILIVLSAVPVALIANIARITVTGLFGEWFGTQFALKVFHDWSAWLMMPLLALVLLWLELKLLAWLVAVPRAQVAVKPVIPTIPGAKAGRNVRAKAPAVIAGKTHGN